MSRQTAIFLDGPGGSGKSTIAPLLGEKMTKLGYEICHIVLPAYQTPIGVFIQSILKGGRESYNNFPKDSLRLLFALNRAEIREYIKAGIDSGYSFIIERSTAANALSIPEALGLDAEQLQRLRAFFPQQFAEILRLEMTNLSQIDREFDFVFQGLKTVKLFLDVDEETARASREARQMIRSDQTKDDIFEQERQVEIRNELFKEMIEVQGGWTKINRVEGVKYMLEKVWLNVKEKLGVKTEEEREGGRQIDFNNLLHVYYPKEELNRISELIPNVLDAQRAVLDREYQNIQYSQSGTRWKPSLAYRFSPKERR